MRRDGRRKRVILIAQGLPDCGGKPNVSVAGRTRVTRSGAGDDTSTNPIINSISCGGDLVHDFLPPLSWGHHWPHPVNEYGAIPIQFSVSGTLPQGNHTRRQLLAKAVPRRARKRPHPRCSYRRHGCLHDESLIKVLYRSLQNQWCSKCEVAHTSPQKI